MKIKSTWRGKMAKAGGLAAGGLITAWIAVGCAGSNSTDADDGVICGAGTMREGNICVASDSTGGGPGTSSGAGGGGNSGSGGEGSADGGVDAAPDGPTQLPPSPVAVLAYHVVDAEQSAALASIVMISDAPSNTLHIFNEITQSDHTIALPTKPIAVAVDPSGKKAAVAYDAHVSWINLETEQILATCQLSSDAYDIALTDAGYAYVVPRTDQWVELHTINLATCAETLSSTLRAGSHIALHPSSKAVFTADQGLSPSRIQRCDITGAVADCTDAEDYADWGTYGFCGNLWTSADGQRIYSACGVTLHVPGKLNVDPCTYGGTLDGVNDIQHLFEAAAAKKIALIPGNPVNDITVRIHETAFLGLLEEHPLPLFPLNGGATATAHGRFVFTTSTLDMIYAVVQADPSSGALHDFAIATFVP